ncbi:MAG: hypothetical protein OXE46_06975 [Chloroflexi bacterium]|nr:hypothetical protein [Chloroflexota bacterium]
MNFDTNLSLDLVITILAILGAVWRIQHVLENRQAELRRELKADNMELRRELKADNEVLRAEYKADNEALRQELKAEIAKSNMERKAENAELREDIRRVEDKVDESNQRIARLEGIILAREGMVDTIVE